VTLLLKYAQTLRKAMGENITSCDYETIHVVQDRVWDSGKMEDMFGADVKEGELVVCTTDLGLLRVVKSSENVGEMEEAVLLPPKVVVQSGIEELMMPVSPA
jgi:hypothetical protein